MAEYYNKPPDQISEEELRQYFLYLKNIKKVSHSTITLALCRIKFLYERSLKRQWATLALVRHQREQTYPSCANEAAVAQAPVISAPESKLRCSHCGQPLLFQRAIQPTGHCPP